MADEKTTIVGKIGVKVYPKTDDFYRETKRDLDAAEKRLGEVEVQVTLDDDRIFREMREMLKRINEEAKKADAKISTDLDKTGALRDADELEAELNRKLDDVKIKTKLTGGKYADEQGLASQKLVNELRGRLRTEQLIAKVNEAAQRDQLVNNGKIGDQLKNQLKVEKLIARANEQASQAKERADEAARRQAIQQLNAEREMNKAFEDRARLAKQVSEDQRRAALQQIQAEREMRADFEARDKAQRAAVIQQLQAEREMQASFEAQDKARRKALADQAKWTREMAKTTREANKLREQIRMARVDKLISPEAYGELRALQTELDDLHAKLSITVNPEDRERIKHQAAKIKDEIEDELDDIEAKVKPNLVFVAMKYVQLALAKLARTRFVTFVPTLSKAAAARVATALSALSGARGASKLLEDLTDLTKDLDKNLPKIGVLANALVGLAGWAGQAASNLFSLANSIAAIGPGALALPGILGGIAIGVGTTIIALKDFNKQIPEAKKGWKDLTKTIRTNFWAQAEAPIRRLGKELFPSLKRGIGATSTELGKFFGTFADGLRRELGGNPLKNMFEDLRKSIDIATDHTGSMAKIIRILGESGAGQLPRLSRFFGQLTDQFAGFLDKADKNGDLQDWIDTAIEGLKDLGNVASGIASILSGLGKAALAGGGSTLKTLGDTLHDIADVVNGPTFQKALTGVLSEANKAMETIARTSGPAVNELFLTLSDTLQKVLPIVGQTIGNAVKALATALADPQLQSGVIDFFHGLASAVDSLTPSLQVLSPAFGDLLSILGTAARTFAPIGNVLLETVGKAFIALAPAIKSVVQSLGGAFLDVLEELSPVLVQVAEDLAPVLAQFGTQMANALRESAPYLAELAKVLGKALGDALKVIGDKLPDIVSHLLPQLLDVVKNIVPKLPDLIDGFLGLVDTLVHTDLIKSLGQLAGSLLDLVKSDVIPTLNEQLPRTADALTKVADALTSITKVFDALDIFGDLVTLIGGVGPDTVSGMLDIGAKIGAYLINGLLRGLQETLPGVIDFLAWLTEMIPQWKGPPETDATLLYDAGASIMQSLIDGLKSIDLQSVLSGFTTLITGAFPAAGSMLSAVGSAIIGGLRSGMGAQGSTVSTKMGEIKQSIMDKLNGAGSYLSSRGGDLIKGLSGGMNSLLGTVQDKAKQALQKAKDGTDGAGSALHGAGSAVIRGFVDYIERGFHDVEAVLNRLTNLLPDWKGPRSTDKVILKEAGQLVIQGFVEGLESQFQSVRDTLGSLSDEIGDTTLAAPSVASISSADLKAMKQTVGAQIAVQGPASGSADQADPQIVFHIQNNNPLPEDPSATATKTLRTAGQMGVLRK